MGVYKKLFNKLKKSKKMKKLKLTPEQKEKLKAIAKKQIAKYSGNTKTVSKPKKIIAAPKEEIKPVSNFWKDEIDLKFIKVNGLQLVVGSTVLIGGAALAIKHHKK